MSINDEKFQKLIIDVKNSNEIVNIISKYVSLKRSGKNYVACCPFHLEKTPSFTVNIEKQFFYCFGCQAGGDVIKFISLIENISYREALVKLAKLANINIPNEYINKVNEETNKLNHYYNLLSDASIYFFKVLTSSKPEAETARQYLYSRGLTDEEIEKFMLGYSFSNPTVFHTAVLKSKKYTINDLEKVGLVIKGKNNQYYDRFFGRIMFPISDKNNHVIGFGGRAILKDLSPKYLNSPETEIYKKSLSFYGINFSNDAIIKLKELILVEGFFDFISLYKNEIYNVLATCGTTLSDYHIRYIESNVEKLYFLYDMDEAGINATMKNFQLFSKANLLIYVVKLDNAKDADEFINKFGILKMKAAISNAVPFTRFLFEYAYKKFGTNNFETKSAIVNFLAPHLRNLNKITQDQYISALAYDLKINEDGIREIIFNKKWLQSLNKNDKTKVNLNEKSDKIHIESDLLNNYEFSNKLFPNETAIKKVEMEILHAIIQEIEFLPLLLNLVNINEFKSPELVEMIEIILSITDNLTLKNNLSEYYKDSNYATIYDKLMAIPLNCEVKEKYFNDLIKKFNSLKKNEKIDELKIKIKEAEAVGDFNTVQKLLNEVKLLQQEIA